MLNWLPFGAGACGCSSKTWPGRGKNVFFGADEVKAELHFGWDGSKKAKRIK